MSRIALCLAASVFLFSCKDDDSDKTTTTNSAKFGATEVTAPANLSKLTSDQAKSFLTDAVAGLSPEETTNLTALFQADDDTTTIEDEPVDEGDDTIEVGSDDFDCLSGLFDKAVVKAKGDTIIIDITADLTQCQTETFTQIGATDIKISQATMGIYAETSCAGGNYDALNGKTLAEIGDTLNGTCAGTITTFTSSASRLIASAKLEDREIKFDTTDSQARSKADGSGCTATLSNGIRTENGCVVVESHVDAVSPTESYFNKSTGNNLTWEEGGAKYFSSGTLDYVINDWTATVSYSAKDIAPTYTMTNGTETTSGTLDY